MFLNHTVTLIDNTLPELQSIDFFSQLIQIRILILHPTLPHFQKELVWSILFVVLIDVTLQLRFEEK